MQISMASIKDSALRMPEPVRSLILSETDSLEPAELITKLATWDKILKMQKVVKT